MRAVNLLPPDLRAISATASAERVAAPGSGTGAFVVLGVLAACVAAVAGFVLVDNTIKQRQSDLAEVTARRQALAGQVARLKPYADFDALAKSRVQTVRDLAGSRFDWEQALRDLSRAVPADVTLKSLSGSVSADAGGGSSVRGAVSAPAITLQGCAPGQSQVARLMARLHDVDGVTRVSLSKSDAEAVQADSASGTEAERRNAAPCGAGKRPTFEVVMFFEKAAAAVSSQPSGTVSATATATATPTPTATPSAGTAASPTSPGGTQ